MRGSGAVLFVMIYWIPVCINQGVPGSSGLKGDRGDSGPPVRPHIHLPHLELLPTTLCTICFGPTFYTFFFYLSRSLTFSNRDHKGCQVLWDWMENQEKWWEYFKYRRFPLWNVCVLCEKRAKKAAWCTTKGSFLNQPVCLIGACRNGGWSWNSRWNWPKGKL